MIQNFGGGELLVIIVLALLVLGPERLPEMAKSAGKALAKFKTMSSGLQDQVQGVMDDPAMQPLKELGELASRPRQKLAEYALEAEAEERARAEKASVDAATSVGTDGAPDSSDGLGDSSENGAEAVDPTKGDDAAAESTAAAAGSAADAPVDAENAAETVDGAEGERETA